MDMVPRKRLTMGWEDDAWVRGVRLLPTLAGYGWTIWEMVSIALFVCFSFENLWRLLARCWNGEKFLAQLLLGWNYEAKGLHML